MTVIGRYHNNQNQEIDFTLEGEHTIDTVIDWVESQLDWQGGQITFDIIN